MPDRVEIKFPDGFKGMQHPVGTIAVVIVALVLIWAAMTSAFTVPAESQGVVLRFGKYTKTVMPGLHFKLPFGLDEHIVLPVERQLKQEFGFGTPGSSDQNQFAPTRNEQQDERNMVTGDLNAATVEWIVQYKIADPRLFLFKVRDPQETLRGISESVMRTAIGDRTVDEVITVGRQEIELEALTQMRRVVERYELGLSIDQVVLKDVNPPDPVKPSFNEVNQAQQESEQMINVANGEYNKVIPRARGEAQQRIQAAEGYALKRINEAQGDVARFNAVFEEYLKAPQVTRRRLYLETMQNVVPQMGRKIVIDSDANQILPLLQLGNQIGN